MEEMRERERERQVGQRRGVEGGLSDEKSNRKGKETELIKLTLWSLSGGRTIVLSMVFRTIFHSSLRTRFSTVFSQILANNIKLQQKEDRLSGLHSEHATQTEPSWLRLPSDDKFMNNKIKYRNRTTPVIHRINRVAICFNLALL